MAFNSADTAAFKNVWVFCEQRQGVMMPTTFELISEGRKLANELGVELCGILLGDNVDGIAAELGGQFDTVTWVPVSKKREHERGYDQARLLAKATAKALGLPLTPTLHKQRNTQPQSGTGDAAKRRANIAGAYRMKTGADVTGKRILLMDDIVTTGATLSECARVLGKAGAEQVVCATVARSAD